MRILKQNTAVNVMVLMTSSVDHITGAVGLILAITASKNGGAFALITVAVTDRGSGWYNLAFTSSHTDTLGDLVVHITAAGADPTDFSCQIFTQTFNDLAVIQTKINEMYMTQGLDIANPSTVTPTTWVAGGVSIVITGDGQNITTMTRQP